MEIFTDFHIHTALSPCGDDDMTPNNIINMAKIKGLHAIAITDHNSCENTEACIKVGKINGLIVIPGMELQTKEDIHVICLFRTLEIALKFQEYVYEHLPHLENKDDIFGKQIIFDEMDNIIGYNKRLLLTATDVSFDEAFYKVKELDGCFIPAHVDKDAFSIISNLGFIPEYLDIKRIEYNSFEKLMQYRKLGFINSKYNIIKSSDAHYLWDISEKDNTLEVKHISIDEIFNSLMK